jgi:two-component system, sensor histidine kinase and response regulator
MNTSKAVVLIVDDVPTNLSVLMKFLQNTGFKVLVATDGVSALEQAEYTQPDVILLDVMMPGMDGFETCQLLKANAVTQAIPVIFMTALSDPVDKVRGFELGAADYITKPLHQEEVVARVNAHLTLYRQKQEIERLREQDRQRYERLSQYKDYLLNTTSHDLKNPLTSIMASTELLRRYLQDPTLIKRLDHIQTSATYMRDLVCNLLDLARLETGIGLNKAPVSLNELLMTSIVHMEMLAQAKGITLVLHPLEEDLTIQCDAFQVGQVLQNLISNAVKYSPEESTVNISAHTDEHWAYVNVADSGMGIPEEDIPHLFERFYRANTSEQRIPRGTGLGLSIVQEIVDQHGGTVSVQSKAGFGSTFTFSLPH